jgi:hypothetical protein
MMIHPYNNDDQEQWQSWECHGTRRLLLALFMGGREWNGIGIWTVVAVRADNFDMTREPDTNTTRN